MFDIQLVVSERQKAPSARFWIIPLVIVFHAIVLATVTVAQYWDLETVPEPPIQVSFFQSTPPPPPPPPPPPKAPAAPQPKVPAPAPTVVVQPVAVPEKPVEAVPDDAMEGLEGVEGGVEGGVPGGVAGGIEGGVVGGVEGGVPGPAPEILRVGGDVTKPELIRSVQPVYPEIARRARISGVVIVEAIIDQSGAVINARILKSLPMGLGEAAVEAVKQWKYKPATLNGRPVAVYFTLTVNFKLQ